MSDVTAIKHILHSNAALLAVVPAAKIMGGDIPQGTVLPAIGISSISTVARHAVAETATELCTSRVQVTVMAKTYVQQKQIIKLVRAGVPRSRGTINGVIVDSILKDIKGPDFRNDDEGIYMQSQDFIVKYYE
jgi:hypothetical protein